ncbi:hypothetical protein MSBRW_1767 [Methanosarcina barkeri str. Wiesmoor]|uniref:Uncharacterized protein n=1 Tax=Methanosarcina barkeri str. Wiesmoor TaxID=1434109 RepID=A0A0E3QJG6_METBA|nr:hypothetical protein [Methanosarcina barkeri]AKB51020.1 hypothetical protein MSBRW_1767 [Methanosarcina barkeri str. Wiesmoor]
MSRHQENKRIKDIINREVKELSFCPENRKVKDPENKKSKCPEDKMSGQPVKKNQSCADAPCCKEAVRQLLSVIKEFLF